VSIAIFDCQRVAHGKQTEHANLENVVPARCSWSIKFYQPVPDQHKQIWLAELGYFNPIDQGR